MKLYATLEAGRGKVVSISDNDTITATVYDGNMKAFSVIIEWCNVGDIEEPAMGAIVTTREWRNEPEDRRKSERPIGDCIYSGNPKHIHKKGACRIQIKGI